MEKIANVNQREGNHAGGRRCPQVAIVILNWNGHKDTRLCLASLRLVHYRPLRIVVVDNGSTVPGIEEIESEYPEVDVLKTGRNLGFSGGNNAGIVHSLEAGAEYVVLLNNDTIVAPDFLEPLIRVLEDDPAAGVASGTVLQYHNEKTDLISYAGGRLSKWRAEAILFGCGQRFKQPAHTKAVSASFVSGCFFAARGSVLQSVGLLDEDFFFGVEDLNFSWTLQKRGIGMRYVPNSIIWHKSGRSRRFDADELYRAFIAKMLLIRKQRSTAVFRLWLLGSSVYILGIGCASFLLRRKDLGFTDCSWTDALAAIMKALSDAWRGQFNTRPGAFRRRD